MSKLTKAQAAAHRRSEEILTQDRLSDDDRDFVITNWQESANHVNSTAGAFFTPAGLASDFTLEVGQPSRLIDLCAGIGALSLPSWRHSYGWDPWDMEIVCVEVNPAYVAVGRKMLPDATWIEASVFDLPDLGRFDVAISNPPFGRIDRASGGAPRYTGGEFEYHVIDVAAELADYGVFIVPQMSAGFAYSGAPLYEERPTTRLAKFHEQTGLTLSSGIGIDCSVYRDEWRGTAPQVEVVTCDLSEARGRCAVHPVRAAEHVPLLRATDDGALFDLPRTA